MSRKQRLALAYCISFLVNGLFWLAYGRELRRSGADAPRRQDATAALRPVVLGRYVPLPPAVKREPKPADTPSPVSGAETADKTGGASQYTRTGGSQTSAGAAGQTGGAQGAAGAAGGAQGQAASSQTGQGAAMLLAQGQTTGGGNAQNGSSGAEKAGTSANGQTGASGAANYSPSGAGAAHAQIAGLKTAGAGTSGKKLAQGQKPSGKTRNTPTLKETASLAAEQKDNKEGSDTKTAEKKAEPDEPAKKPKPTSAVSLKIVKMWTPKPGQKFNLASSLNISLPKNLQLVPGPPLTSDQIEQLKKLLQQQKLRHVGLDRKQLKKLLEARRTTESKRPPEKPKPGDDARKRERERQAHKPKPRVPRPQTDHKPKLASASMQRPRSPFTYKQWNSDMFKRWAPRQDVADVGLTQNSQGTGSAPENPQNARGASSATQSGAQRGNDASAGNAAAQGTRVASNRRAPGAVNPLGGSTNGGDAGQNTDSPDKSANEAGVLGGGANGANNPLPATPNGGQATAGNPGSGASANNGGQPAPGAPAGGGNQNNGGGLLGGTPGAAPGASPPTPGGSTNAGNNGGADQNPGGVLGGGNHTGQPGGNPGGGGPQNGGSPPAGGNQAAPGGGLLGGGAPAGNPGGAPPAGGNQGLGNPNQGNAGGGLLGGGAPAGTPGGANPPAGNAGGGQPAGNPGGPPPPGGGSQGQGNPQANAGGKAPGNTQGNAGGGLLGGGASPPNGGNQNAGGPAPGGMLGGGGAPAGGNPPPAGGIQANGGMLGGGGAPAGNQGQGNAGQPGGGAPGGMLGGGQVGNPPQGQNPGGAPGQVGDAGQGQQTASANAGGMTGDGTGSGEAGAMFLGGEQGDGMDADGGQNEAQANTEDTGFAPAVASAPDLPAENPSAKKGIPGSLVLPPSPPMGTENGKLPTPRRVKKTLIQMATEGAPAAQGRQATRPLPASAPRAPQKMAKAPVGMPTKPRRKAVRLALTVGSTSLNGTLPFTVMDRPHLPVGAVSDAVDPPLPPAKGVQKSQTVAPKSEPSRSEKATRSARPNRAGKPVAAKQASPPIVRTAKNSQGIKNGTEQPLPPTPLPDSDMEVGDGSGLKGEYYLGRKFDQYQFTRADPMVDFDWKAGESPSPRIPSGTDYTIRWTGKIQPKYSQTYTFYATADDGVRVWINHKLIIDDWSLHAATQFSNTIPLQAGQQYLFKVEYLESAGGAATVQLYWESPSQPKEFIPEDAFFYPLPGDEDDMKRDKAPL